MVELNKRENVAAIKSIPFPAGLVPPLPLRPVALEYVERVLIAIPAREMNLAVIKVTKRKQVYDIHSRFTSGSVPAAASDHTTRSRQRTENGMIPWPRPGPRRRVPPSTDLSRECSSHSGLLL